MASIGNIDVTINVSTSAEPTDEWAIVELLGHRTWAGVISEVERFGAKLLRIDIPQPPAEDGTKNWKSEFYAPSALYGLTPCTEEKATKQAMYSWPVTARIKAVKLLTGPVEEEYCICNEEPCLCGCQPKEAEIAADGDDEFSLCGVCGALSINAQEGLCAACFYE